MSSSANEDREQRITTTIDKSDLMTIEFLRARLLAERSVSKTARQRADELANRVAELEEQLKFVYLQRERAEKATSDILVILKNHGIGDLSEEFNSSSEQEENSSNEKLRNNGKESNSSSEIESSQSTGRSLSWKSTRNSQHSFEKKKYIDPVRRRASFPSNCSLSRRVGKSCRRIKRRETRSVDEFQNEGNEGPTYSRDSSNCSNGETAASAEHSGYADGKSLLENPALGQSSGTQKVNNDRYFEKDKEMESAMLHKAQLISRYEEEEKAQREWEDKFTQDSYDLGNHSDVTEDRYETKPTGMSYNQEKKQHLGTSKVSLSLANADKGSLVAPESSASDLSFPKSLKSLEDTGKSNEASKQCTIDHTALSGNSSRFELAVVPQETSNNLGSILEALVRAKSSLSEKLGDKPGIQIPFGTPGLFRLPTDFQFEATTRAQPSFANDAHEFAGDRFLTEPRGALSRTLTQEMRSRSQPRLMGGSSPSNTMGHLNHYSNPVLQDSYPFLPDIRLHIPPNEEALSKNFLSSEKGLPPVMRLS